MRAFKNPADSNLPQGFSASDKKRLIGMSLALLIVLFAIGYSWLKGKQGADTSKLPVDDFQVTESVAVPKLDTAELERLVQDESSEQRVILEGEALDLVLANTRRLTERHYALLSKGSLDATGREKLFADPKASRGDVFVARGWLRGIAERQRTVSSPPEYHGRLVDTDGSTTYFVLDQKPERTLVDVDYVRLDGRFLKVFSEEDPEAPGTWVEGPLLVGTTLTVSRPEIPHVAELDHLFLHGEIEHDGLAQDAAGNPIIENHDAPYDAIWHAMAWGRDGSQGVDWASAPELDWQNILAIRDDPDEFVGKAFRFPISRLQGSTVRRATENPARLERYTEGWIANNTWKTLVHFWSPTQNEALAVGDYVNAKGIFLRNFAYSSKDRGVQVAPMFIVTEIESFEPAVDPFFKTMAIGIAVGAIALTAIFILVIRRDRKKAREVQQKATERRRARRAAGKIPSIPTGSPKA